MTFLFRDLESHFQEKEREGERPPDDDIDILPPPYFFLPLHFLILSLSLAHYNILGKRVVPLPQPPPLGS